MLISALTNTIMSIFMVTFLFLLFRSSHSSRKGDFFTKKLLIFSQKRMLWVLIRSALLMSNQCFCVEIRKTLITIPLLSGALPSEACFDKGINSYHSLGRFCRQQIDDIFLICSQYTGFDISCKLRQFA